MDTSIRKLIDSAQKYTGREKNPSLLEAYRTLKYVSDCKAGVSEAYSADLYVLCAEAAIQNKNADIARDCLNMYFVKKPPGNQFLCRAYLCQAQLLAPKNEANPDQFDKAVLYVLKALTFAKENPRYHFLVYNASVLYWQFCRPFLKTNYRQYLARSLHQVVKVLDDIDDKDFEWRAQLMIALIECHIDAGRRTDATHIVAAASTFIRQNVPALYKKVFGLMVRNQLVESGKLHKDLKSPELAVYYKICKLKVSLEQNEARDFYQDIQQILYQLGVISEEPRVVPEASRGRSKNRNAPAKGLAASQDDESDEIVLSEDDIEKSPGKGGRRTPTPTTTKTVSTESSERPHLLLELARLCMELDIADLAKICTDHITTCVVKDAGVFLECEFLHCELMIKLLGDQQESYLKSCIQVRLQAIQRCSEAIQNAIRQNDANVIQAGCLTQWNLCLPLMQHKLRQHIRKSLTLVAEALGGIDSLLIGLRCQVHMELSKCEEDGEQIEGAMTHLKKALQLDDAHMYEGRLQHALHRLQLRAELYQQAEMPEDQAAIIIEQARKADSGTIRMKRSLLMKAGEALAPDAFLLVLDSESDTKDVTSGKMQVTEIKRLAGKAYQFNKCVKKAEGHLKRLGNQNDRQRALLWADLAKTARKQEVWDVCRVAARFCLLYDDARWKNLPPVKSDSPKFGKQITDTLIPDVGSATQLDDRRGGSRQGSRPTSPDKLTQCLFEKDLVRILAEVNFIFGECLVHLLRSEGVELNNKPIPPKDKSKRPKGYVAKKPEEDPDWICYCEWIEMLSESSTKAFLRGLALGVELSEPWAVCCATTYIWNYNTHILDEGRHHDIIEDLQTCLDGLRKVGHAGETSMLVNLCSALSYGYIKPWLLSPEKEAPAEPTPPPEPAGKGKRGAARVGTPKSKTGGSASISPDAAPDLKKAIEVCDYVIQVTGGDNLAEMVPISVRMPLLQTWVLAKQMLQVQINKTFGTDDETNSDGQRPMTRAIVVIEMIQLGKNGLMEFKDSPTLPEALTMIESCKWTDKFIELQLWSRLALLSFESSMHNLVIECSKKALRFSVTGTQSKNKKPDKHKLMVENEMLSYASGLMGQSLVSTMNNSNAIRWDALTAFLNSAKFACNAENHQMVMAACRHYWNTCLPLVSQSIERDLLREPIKLLLEFINTSTVKAKKEDTGDDAADEGQGDVVGSEDATVKIMEPQAMNSSLDADDDLTLRAALYGVLFQSYSDKGEWEEGLTAMDQAVNDMPRTSHRLLIFKHRVMVKAQLGRGVQMDIAKFKDESEDYVAHMWRRVALCSKDTTEQLTAYQQAIEALRTPESEWQKFDLLVELAQWLYTNDFPIQDCLDQLHWATDIILSMHTRAQARALEEEEEKKLDEEVKKSKKLKVSAKSKKPSKPSATDTKSQKRTENLEKQKEMQKVEKLDTLSEKEGSTDINAADYIPVVKKATIGVEMSQPPPSINELEDVQQLEAIMRVHILMSEMAGHASQSYADYCFVAYGCLMRIWQLCIATAGAALKEVIKHGTDGENEKSSAKGKKKDDKEAGKSDKPKRKVDVIPQTCEDWAQYDVPDEIFEAFKHESMARCGLNKKSLNKPHLTLHYLDKFCVQLQQLGYHQLTLPLLAFCDMLSRDLLKSRPLHILVHLRSLDICVQLNLKNGVAFHEKLLGEVCIHEDDQASCREEIATWQEKQLQVMQEEIRIKESLSSMVKPETGSKSAAKVTSPGKASATTGSPMKDVSVISKSSMGAFMNRTHLGEQLGALTFRQVWTDIAETLIKQGIYQKGREFLAEAHKTAIAFSDVKLQAQILYLLAQLAHIEAQYGQCVNLCREAQNMHYGDEVFWYETTILTVDALLADPIQNRKKQHMARSILVDTLNIFQQLREERVNRACIIDYVIARLHAKLADVQVSITLEDHADVNVPKVMRALLSAAQKYENAVDLFLKCFHARDAVQVMKRHAWLLRHMASRALEREIRHTYQLEAVAVLREAISVAEQTDREVQTCSYDNQLKGVSLPVQRELCDIQLTCGEALAETFTKYIQEQRQRQREEERKGSVVKMVEELVRANTPTYTHMEKEWKDNEKLVAEEAISLCLNAHGLSQNIPHLKTRSLCAIGHCLLLLSSQISIDPPSQWTFNEMDIPQLLEEVPGAPLDDEQHPEDEEDMPVETDVKLYAKLSRQMRKLNAGQDSSVGYLVQATDVLTQALTMALNNGYKDLASQASLDLVECCGQFDASIASQFLALHQSCSVSVYMETLLYKSQPDPSTSRLAALLHQRRNILQDQVTSNASQSPIMTSIETALGRDWQAWKKLLVLPTHLELLKELPANFNFLILQHSPDRRKLYGAMLEKSSGKSAVATGVKGGDSKKQQAQPSSNKARVLAIDTDPCEIVELVSQFNQHKRKVQQLLLKHEYQRSQAAQRQKMLENLDNTITISPTKDLGNADEERELDEEFFHFVTTLDNYLAPILTHLDNKTRSVMSPTAITGTQREKDKEKEPAAPPPPSECLIILADQWLLELPLEALSCLQSDNLTSVSRDFSLQMLYHRFTQDVPTDEVGADKKKPKKEAKDIPPRIPGLKDANKKQGKIIPLNRTLLPWCQPVDTMNFRFIVDPYMDCSETETHAPLENFNKLMETHEQQFTPRWLGVLGTDHVPSVGELEIYLTESSSFIFYGMERLLSHISPAHLATLNIPECLIMCALDLAQTNKSFLRQSKIDTLKSVDVLTLERPLETAMLISLTGVKCAMVNQWHCTLTENSARLQSSMTDMLADGLSTGQSMCLQFFPHRRQTNVDENNSDIKPADVAPVTGPAKERTASISKPRRTSEASSAIRSPVPPERLTPSSTNDRSLIEKAERSCFNMVCYGMPNLVITQF